MYKYKKGDILILCKYEETIELVICDGFYRFNSIYKENEYNYHTINGVLYSSAKESELFLTKS